MCSGILHAGNVLPISIAETKEAVLVLELIAVVVVVVPCIIIRCMGLGYIVLFQHTDAGSWD